MAIDNLLSLAATSTLFGNQVVNVWGFKQISEAAGFNGQLLIDDWQAGCQVQYLATITGSVTLNRLSARAVYPDSHELAEETLVSSNVGTSAGAAGANQLAGIITWRTALAGRSYRGRSYLPGMNTSWVVNGLWNASAQAVMNAYVSAMILRFGPSGTSLNFRLVTISRYAGKAQRVTPIGTPITTGIARDVPGTIRRRRIGVGA